MQSIKVGIQHLNYNKRMAVLCDIAANFYRNCRDLQRFLLLEDETPYFDFIILAEASWLLDWRN